MSADDPTNPGGHPDLTPFDSFMLRVERRLASIHKIAADTYDEVVSLRPRVTDVENRLKAVEARQVLQEQELERLKAYMGRADGGRNPTPVSRPEGV